MKWILTLFICCYFTIEPFCQQQTYDIASYTVPAGWKEERNTSFIAYSRQDGGSWSQIAIYQHTVSTGDILSDFSKEWQDLVVTPYKITTPPDKVKPETAEGWTVMSGSGLWKSNGTSVATILTTFSNKEVCVSVLCNATAKPYLEMYKSFIASLKLEAVNGQPVDQPPVNNTQQTISPASLVSEIFKFNETKFDDGWVATIKPDWVEVTKSGLRVLLHYPKEGTIFPADPEPLTNAAWNILVAPRYSNATNYRTRHVNNSSDRPYLGIGDLTDIQTGNRCFVVLFRRSGGWMEVISRDSLAFAEAFGFNPGSIRWAASNYYGGYVVDNDQGKTIEAVSAVFDKLEKMNNYNRFAVGASDLNNTGEWNASFSSNTFLFNYHTGVYAGMNTFSSSQWFVFGKNNSYTWNIAGTNSAGGRTAVSQANGKGIFRSVNNWQISFSNIEGKPKLYDVYFTAIKNGRILFMNDAKYPGSGIFQGFQKKQK